MKKALTLIALVMAVVMLFSLSACGGRDEQAQPEAGQSAPGEPMADLSELEPQANVDPGLVNMGQAIDEAHTADAWYKDGIEGGDYIYFELADNSDMGYAYVKVENGERVNTILCTVNDEMHLVDADAEAGQSAIDLVFVDDFKIYDHKSSTWYVRGNPESLSLIFSDVKFAERDDPSNTLLLKADGSGIEVFQGEEDELTWVMDSATTVKYNDGSHDHILQIVLDENGKLVSLSEQNFRIFVPAAEQ